MASRPTPRIWRHSTGGRAGSRRASSSSSTRGDGREDSNTGSSIRPFTQASLERLETRACEARKHFGAMPRRPARLEDGDLLPNKFSPFPAHMYGRPLEEFDRFILDETFCAVSRRFNKNYIHRFTATRTFYLFSPWNPVRRACIFLSTNQYFDYVVMCTIISNCIFLAMSNPPDEAEFIFLAIYSLEATIKSIAKGFILNKYTYLRSAWNWLDFIVIVLGYVTMFVQLGNLAGLRTFRVLRALKTVSIMPGLRTIINALLNSLTQLVEVMSLTVFCLMVFALFALQVFMGALRNKCVVTPQTPEEWRIRLNDSSYWALDHADSFAVCGNGSGAQQCLPGYVCVANIGDNPNFGYTNFDNFFWAMLTTFQLITLDFWEDVYNKVIAAVGPWSIIFFGMVVFFGSFYLINLMLAVVAMSYEVEAENTGEEKSKDLTDHRDDSTFSFDPSNLKLRQLDKNSKFSNVRLKDNSLLSYNYKKKKKKRTRTTTGDGSLGDNCSEVSPVPGEFAAAHRSGPSLVGELLTPGGFEEEENEDRRHGEPVPSPAPSGLSPVPRLQPISPGGVSWLEGVTQRHPLRSSCEQLLEDSPPPPAARGGSAGGTGASVRVFPGGQRGEYFVHITTGQAAPAPLQLPQHQLQQPRETLRANMFGPSVESQGIGVGGGGGNSESSSGDRRSVVDAGGGRRGVTIRACSLDDSGVVGDQESDRGRDLIVPVEEITRYDSAADGRQYTIPQTADKCNGINSDCDSQDRSAYVSHVVEIPDELEDRNCGWCPKVCPNYAGWLHWQNRLYQFVSDPCFDVFITLCIILNTLFLALEHHGMTTETKDALEIGNRVFTSIFTLECFLKVSSNCKHFFLNGWNVFDLVVVLASLVELSLQDINGLSVLRVLRLLRVLKLAQSWTTMRVLLSIIISSLGALGNLTFVLVIVIYIFAVIGMQLFAASYTDEVFAPDPIPRWNFNDFFHAFMMIFRILCGEWIEPLWDCMRAKQNEWEICLAVFLPTLVMGNFLVLNLFLALLLNSFNCEELKTRKEEARGKSKLVQSMHRLKGYIRHHRQERQALMVVRAFRSGSKTAGPMAVETTIEVPTELPCEAGDPRHTAAVWHRQRQSLAEENGFKTVQSKLEDATPELELYLPGMGRDGSVCDQDMFLQSMRSCDFPDNNELRSHALITMGPRGSPELRAVNLRQQSSVSFSSPEADAPWTQKSWCRGQRDSTEFEVINRRPISEQEPRDSMRHPDAKLSRISSEKDSFDAGRESNDFDFCPGRLLRGSSAERRARDLTPEERLRASQSPSSTSNWSNLATYVETLRGKSKDEGGEEDGGRTANKNESDVAATVRKEPPDCLPTGCYQYLPCQSESSQSSCLYTLWVSTRRAALKVVLNSYFEWIVLTMIVASSVTLCFEDKYLYRKPYLQMALRMANLGFAVLFAAEMVLRQVALGLKKYFTNAWTILDFVIVVASIFSLAIEENERLVALRSLRTVRALRPLRAISRWQGMKIVVNALMFAIPSIFNVLLVCLVFWLIFSIMGVQFFSGQFYKCIDDTGSQLTIDVVNDKFDCLQKNFTWTNSKISFDNVGHAYLALLQVATFEGWMEVMKDAVDTRGVDLQPSREANLYAYIYFVVFIVCGSFFTLNLFIGVIIDNFNMLKKKYEGGVLEMFLTDSQKNYYTALKKLGRKKPQKVIRRPINQHHAIFYDIAISRRFEIAIFALIFLNMVIMSIEHYQQPPVITAVLEIFNIIFTTVFSMEALVKIIGLRWHYFTVPWNLFDFVLVGLSILSMIIESEQMHTEFPIPPTLLRVVRVFRIGRILRLIKAAKGIRKLLFALIVSLPALFNIGALLFLIMFIYAIIGMALFANVKHTGIINDIMNFETFGNSMMLLFRLITSAGWNDVLDPLMMQPPECDLDVKSLSGDVLLYGNCGQPAFAIVFFVTFIVINFMIVINMYIAVILENFNQAHQEEEIGIVEEDLEMFYVRWAKYDPHATQFINFSQVSDFVSSLDPPMVIPKPNTVALVSFDLPIAKGDKIHCLDILHALTKHVLGYVEESEEFEKLQEQMNEKFKKQFPTRKELEIVSSTRQWKQMDLAARVLQRSMKQFLKSRRERQRLALALGDLQTQTSPGRSPSATPMFLQRVASYLHVPGLASGRRSRTGSLASVSACSDSAGSSRRSSCNIGETFGRMGFVGAGLPGLDLGGFGNGGRSSSGRRRRDPAPPRHECPASRSGSAPAPPRVQIDLPTEEMEDEFPMEEEESHHRYRTVTRYRSSGHR